MNSVRYHKISNLYFGFSRVENVHHFTTQEILQNQTTGKLLQELKKANQLFLSQAQKYGLRFEKSLSNLLNINKKSNDITTILKISSKLESLKFHSMIVNLKL